MTFLSFGSYFLDKRNEKVEKINGTEENIPGNIQNGSLHDSNTRLE